jgi:eukaryotic-like serine/threonine-protein kinase
VTRSSSFVDTLIGTRIAGRYVVDKILGSGGMGIVASAKHPDLGTRVAIKFLRPEHADDEVVKQRFLREGRLAARVKSSHFVRVVDVGTLENGVPYLVMEMLAGRDLSDDLRARGPLPVAEAVDIILQACTGIAELHAIGVVHRDLKPSNLFVNEAAGAKMIKVLDFGISKEQRTTDAKNQPLTSTDNVLGTPQYMSPEQIKASKDVDPRSDVWALGIILYELLTQRLPFVAEGPGVGELFARILYFDPVKPTEHRADLPPELEAVIMTCLTRDLKVRYANVGALAEALRPFAAAKSLHRIDAVQEALSTPTPHVEESMPPPPNALPDDEKKEISLAATVQVGQGNQANKTPPKATTRATKPASDPVVSIGVEAESINASSVELGGIPKKKKSAALTIALVSAAAVLVGGIAFWMSSKNDGTQPLTTAGTGIVSTPPPPASTSTPTPPAASVAPTAWERESASVPATGAPPPAATSAHPAIVGRPPATGAKPGATKPSAPAKPTSTTSDPILDRK